MIIQRFGVNSKSKVIELGSNDGYLLQYFKNKNIPVLGVDPALNVTKVAIEKGIPTLTKFFSYETAKHMKKDGQTADVLLGINFLAQIPELNDFVKGMKLILKEDG